MGRMHSKASTQSCKLALLDWQATACFMHLANYLNDGHCRSSSAGSSPVYAMFFWPSLPGGLVDGQTCASATVTRTGAGRTQIAVPTSLVRSLPFAVLQGKGMSSSALPYKRSAPSWLKTTPQEVQPSSSLPVRCSASSVSHFHACAAPGPCLHSHSFSSCGKFATNLCSCHFTAAVRRLAVSSKVGCITDTEVIGNTGGGADDQAGEEGPYPLRHWRHPA